MLLPSHLKQFCSTPRYAPAVAILVCVSFLPLAEASAAFILGVNLGGDAVTIEGQAWQSDAVAQTNGLSWVGNFTPFVYSQPVTPAVDLVTEAMLQDVRYVPSGFSPISVSQDVPNGVAYTVELWTYEGFLANGRAADLSGDITATNVNNLPLGGYQKLTLTTPVINDGSIDFTITTVNNQPTISGFAIFSIEPQALILPEPASSLLVGLGIFGLTALRRRRRD